MQDEKTYSQETHRGLFHAAVECARANGVVTSKLLKGWCEKNNIPENHIISFDGTGWEEIAGGDHMLMDMSFNSRFERLEYYDHANGNPESDFKVSYAERSAPVLILGKFRAFVNTLGGVKEADNLKDAHQLVLTGSAMSDGKTYSQETHRGLFHAAVECARANGVVTTNLLRGWCARNHVPEDHILGFDGTEWEETASGGHRLAAMTLHSASDRLEYYDRANGNPAADFRESYEERAAPAPRGKFRVFVNTQGGVREADNFKDAHRFVLAGTKPLLRGCSPASLGSGSRDIGGRG